jgi:hypothetical protein
MSVQQFSVALGQHRVPPQQISPARQPHPASAAPPLLLLLPLPLDDPPLEPLLEELPDEPSGALESESPLEPPSDAPPLPDPLLPDPPLPEPLLLAPLLPPELAPEAPLEARRGTENAHFVSMKITSVTSRPAEPERHDPHVGLSQPCASTWGWERAYNGPPEDGQPRAGSAPQPGSVPRPRPKIRW